MWRLSDAQQMWNIEIDSYWKNLKLRKTMNKTNVYFKYCSCEDFSVKNNVLYEEFWFEIIHILKNAQWSDILYEDPSYDI